VDPAKLGDLTVSMLLGEHGRQKKELQKLVNWLSDERPDVVHLSNSMLLGMAREIRRLGLPVICSLSGEDIFLEKLTEPHYSQARAALRQRAGDADAFVSLNHYYADYMAEYLHAPREQIRVIPHGVDLEGHGSRGPRADGRAVVGYLARICPDKGLHHLVAAMELLMAEDGLPPVRLRVAGYLSPADRPYLDGIVARASSWPNRFELEHVGEVSRAGKIEFLQSLDVMSVPTVYRESKGLSILEALANAVPVVQPAHGTFPEIIEDTGGGLLFEPDNPASLAQQIKRLVVDPELAQQLGRAGQQAVKERYHAGVMAERTRDLYHELSRATRGKRPARTVSGIS
jgi:glycosyltransferase involved in cell wall biosynthesis